MLGLLSSNLSFRSKKLVRKFESVKYRWVIWSFSYEYGCSRVLVLMIKICLLGLEGFGG